LETTEKYFMRFKLLGYFSKSVTTNHFRMKQDMALEFLMAKDPSSTSEVRATFVFFYLLS